VNQYTWFVWISILGLCESVYLACVNQYTWPVWISILGLCESVYLVCVNQYTWFVWISILGLCESVYIVCVNQCTSLCESVYLVSILTQPVWVWVSLCLQIAWKRLQDQVKSSSSKHWPRRIVGTLGARQSLVHTCLGIFWCNCVHSQYTTTLTVCLLSILQLLQSALSVYYNPYSLIW